MHDSLMHAAENQHDSRGMWAGVKRLLSCPKAMGHA